MAAVNAWGWSARSLLLLLIATMSFSIRCCSGRDQLLQHDHAFAKEVYVFIHSKSVDQSLCSWLE
jgi:hypothetical protein